jgi:hypothetical protein
MHIYDLCLGDDKAYLTLQRVQASLDLFVYVQPLAFDLH